MASRDNHPKHSGGRYTKLRIDLLHAAKDIKRILMQPSDQQVCSRDCTSGHTYQSGCELARVCYGKGCGDCMECGYAPSDGSKECT